MKLFLFLALCYSTISICISQSIGNEHGDEVCEFAFASYYQNNMVLQMAPYRSVLWGYGTIGATVNISVMQDVYSTQVVRSSYDGTLTKCGVWHVTLRPHKAGRSYDMQGVHDNRGRLSWILLRQVLFGEVWVCGGQSNMEFTMHQVINASEELKNVASFTNIRVFKVPRTQSTKPLEDFQQIEVEWSHPTPEIIGNGDFTYFSAVCWLYGKYLYEHLNVPIGLVESCWGGTPVEAWSNENSLKKCGITGIMDQLELNKDLTDSPHAGSVLWNAMINPLVNMTIRGAIWYQGESNTNFNRDKYSCTFPTMISQWRDAWFEGTRGQSENNFPFGFVQLSDTVQPDMGGYPQIRWHQTADFGLVPNKKMENTFMAVAMDLFDHMSPYGPVHPRYKQDVAARLTMAGLKQVYKMEKIPDYPFPQYITSGINNTINVHYQPDQLLVVNDQENFELCCGEIQPCSMKDLPRADNWKTVNIIKQRNNIITLDGTLCRHASLNLRNVAKVRYAWALTPCKEFKKCSVYNHLGLPGPLFIMSIGK